MSFIDTLVNVLRTLFSGPREPARPPVTRDESLQRLTPRVLVIVYDPVVVPATGQRLSQHPLASNWNRVDDLIADFIADVQACSGGLVQYRVIERVVADHFLLTESGFRYTGETFLHALNGRVKPNEQDLANYRAIINEFNLLARVASDELDEVWLFGGPFFGFYESRMAGNRAFWCNAPPIENTDGRRFVIMGFNYERGVGEMLEDLGHRAESMMKEVYWRAHAIENLYERYVRYDKIAPGRAEMGSVHFAPNSERDYDWGNPRTVASRCDNWLHFPEFQNRVKQVNCAEWGNGDIRLHHKWWLSHLPKVAGDTNGILNNWWQYVIQCDHPIFDPA